MKTQYKIVIMLLYITLISGCSLAPSVNVTLIDRHTVMESEAAGEWPHIEDSLHLHKGPIPLADVNESKKEKRAFKMLNGEFTSKSLTQSK